MNGLLLVDKPAGPTSHDVVAAVRRWAGTRRVGHLGTLDPAAEGLLVLCIGEALKAVPWMEGFDKEYQGRLRLGLVTDTQDTTGRVVAEREWGDVTESALREACAGFVGERDQVPPMVSALKVGGRKLVDLARAGQEVERRPRRVTVHAWRIERIALPEAEFTVRVSKGTYVRTLCHDLGAVLGCGAAMSWLRRTRVGPFDVVAAVAPASLPEGRDPPGRAFRPVREGVAHLPGVPVTTAEAQRLRRGRRIPIDSAAGSPVPGGGFGLATDAAGELVAVVRRVAAEWRPARVFPEGVR